RRSGRGDRRKAPGLVHRLLRDSRRADRLLCGLLGNARRGDLLRLGERERGGAAGGAVAPVILREGLALEELVFLEQLPALVAIDDGTTQVALLPVAGPEG